VIEKNSPRPPRCLSEETAGVMTSMLAERGWPRHRRTGADHGFVLPAAARPNNGTTTWTRGSSLHAEPGRGRVGGLRSEAHDRPGTICTAQHETAAHHTLW